MATQDVDATWRSRGFLLLLVAAGVALRAATVDHPLTYFEAHTMRRTFEPTTLAWAMAKGDHSFFKQGFYYWISGRVTEWFGWDLAAVRLLSVLAGAATIYYAYKLGKTLLGVQAARVFTVLTALLWVPVLIGGLARCYSLLQLTVIASSYYCARLLQNPTKAERAPLAAAYVGVAATAFYLNPGAAAIVGIHGLAWIVTAWHRRELGLLYRGAAVFGAVGLLCLPFVPYLRLASEVVLGHAESVTFSQFARFASFKTSWAPWLFGALIAAALVIAWRRRGAAANWTRESFAIAALTVVALVPISIALVAESYAPRTISVRYLTIFTPAVQLLCAYVLTAFTKDRVRAHGAAVAAVALICLGTWYGDSKVQPQIEPLEGVARTVAAAHPDPSTTIITDSLDLLRYPLTTKEVGGTIVAADAFIGRPDWVPEGHVIFVLDRSLPGRTDFADALPLGLPTAQAGKFLLVNRQASIASAKSTTITP